MYSYRIKYLLSVFLILSASAAVAQTSTISNPLTGRENSPYSQYGIGELVNGNNTVLRGMGDVTSAYESPYAVNSDNPASYSFLALTTYEAGAQASIRTLNGNGLSYTTGTTTLAYLNIGIPLGKHGGMCLGLRPVSHIYYDLSDTVAGYGQAYSGDGNLNYAYIGGAYRLGGLSLGFNFGYMFGTLRNTSEILNIDTTTKYDAEFSTYNKIGGIYWKGGIMYETKLNKNLRLTIGGTVSLTQNLKNNNYEYWVGSYQLSDTLIQDTAFNASERKGILRMPLSYSAGIHLAGNERWDIGVDYSATDWSQYNNTFDSSGNQYIAKNTYRFAVGGEVTPNPTDTRNYWARATYRLGGYYGTNYVSLNGSQLRDYGVTAGISLPVRRSFSHVHAALAVGKIDGLSGDLIKQTYVRFTFGVSFNDKWFVKRRYD